jgi:CubicO group peptidase (beta-lactamase class C family)
MARRSPPGGLPRVLVRLETRPAGQCAYQLTEEGSFVSEPPQVFQLQSAGGLWSTGPDLVRFGSGWRALLPGELPEQALRPQAPQRDPAQETGFGWGLRRAMDVVGQAGTGPGWAASLIMRPSTGRTIVVLTNRLLPVLAVNVELIRSTVFTPQRRHQAARLWTSQTAATMRSTDSASSQSPSIHWNGQNRLAGW